MQQDQQEFFVSFETIMKSSFPEMIVAEQDSVFDIKRQLTSITRVPVMSQYLQYNGIELKSTQKVKDFAQGNNIRLAFLVKPSQIYRIKVKNVDGRFFEQNYDGPDPINDLFDDTLQYFNMSLSAINNETKAQYKLTFNGVQLDCSLCFQDYNFKHIQELQNVNNVEFDILRLQYTLKIQLVNKNIQNILVEPNATIESVKIKISDITNMQPNTFKLNFEGKVLENGDQINNCGIRHESLLQVVLYVEQKD